MRSRQRPHITIYLRWIAALCLLLIIAPASGSPVAAQENTVSQLTVVAPALNVRSGPGTTFDVLTFLTQGQQVEIIGYDTATDWWQIR